MTVGPAIQRLFALAILAGVILMAWAWIVAPVAERFDRYEEAASQSRLLIDRYRGILASKGALERDVDALHGSRIREQGFLVAPSAELGAALLQERIKQTAEGAAAALISIQVLAPKEDAGLSRISVRARLKGDIVALSDVLYELETAWPAMFIDNLHVRTRTRRARRDRNSPAQLTVDPALNVSFDISAIMEDRRGARPSPAKGVGR